MQQPDSRWDQAGDAEPSSSRIIPFLLMAAVSVALCAIGYFAFSFQKQQIKQDNADQLSAIASLKIEQITTWLEERKGDAFALSHHSRFADLMDEYRETGALAEAKRQWLLERLKTIQKAYRYDAISLYDRNGKEFLSLETAATPNHHDAGLPIAAIREQSLQLSDLHLAEDGKPELDLAVPLLTGGKKGESVSGALQLRIDPNQFLFPFIQYWPTPSKTGETLLVRREGDSILYLNELRHYPGSAMKLYRSIDSSIPAARALQGESGSLSGVDYRGKPVIAHARPVPGTSWMLVVKMDEEEIYAPIHRIGLYVSLAVLLLITFANATLFFWWRQRHARFIARHAQALLEKKVLAQHFDYLSKYANDIIVLTDRDGLIVEANDRALEAYGYTREEFLGTYAATHRAKEARDQFAGDWQKLYEQGRVLYETRHQRKDGTTFPVEISLREFEVEGQAFVQGVIRDITERKIAEEALLRYQEHLEDAVATRTAALQESEERVRLILESSGEGIFGVDLEGRITFVNSAACKILGYTPEQLLGVDSHATFHHTLPDGVPYPADECPLNRAYLKGIASQVYDEVFWSRDGLAIPVEYAATPLCKGNEFIGAVVSFRDISERKAAEAKLLSREHFLRTITDALPGMVGYWTADLKCRFANKAYLEWFGKRLEDMIGISIQEFLGEELFRKNEPYIRKALDGEEQHFERTLIKANGEASHTWAHYIPDDMDGRVRGFFVLVTDVTALKQAQLKLELTNQALQARSEEAETASRAKGVFLANMSHELRTPLHAVIGFSRLMANDPSFSEPQRRNLEIIHHAGNHLLSLIDDILEYSKIDAGHMLPVPTNVHLEGLLREVAGMLEARAKEAGLTLMLETTSLPTCVSIDAAKLRQILINLLTNAIKYTKQGGIILAVTGTPAEDNQVELSFAVSDTGIGIADENLESIFEPFVQAAPSSRQSGTGLGLSISRQYVRMMGGELVVESVSGEGSTFRFTLKIPRIDMLEGATQFLVHTAIGFAHRILLVDDDAEGRLELKELLERLGYTVMEADGAVTAESCLALFQPELIFMDWQMPEIDGIEATRRIRAREDIKQPIIVMITAYSFEEHESAALAAGIDAFIGKPINVDKIYESLGHWFSMESVPSFPRANNALIGELSPGKLDSLPADVREQLSQAVIELNPEKISAAVALIEATQPEMFRYLNTLVDSLQYGRIGHLLGIAGFEDM